MSPLRRLGSAVAVLAGVLGVAAPAGAHTSVAFTRRAVTVTAPGARAVIARAPFGLAVQQADGAPALAEVANRRHPGSELAGPFALDFVNSTGASAIGDRCLPDNATFCVSTWPVERPCTPIAGWGTGLIQGWIGACRPSDSRRFVNEACRVCGSSSGTGVFGAELVPPGSRLAERYACRMSSSPRHRRCSGLCCAYATTRVSSAQHSGGVPDDFRS